MIIPLPPTLEIGSITYRLLRGPDVNRELARESLAGQCAFREAEIRLYSTYPDQLIPPDRIRKTVLHELLHAVDNEYQGDDGLTEAQTDRLAQGLAQVFKQLGLTFGLDDPPTYVITTGFGHEARA